MSMDSSRVLRWAMATGTLRHSTPSPAPSCCAAVWKFGSVLEPEPLIANAPLVLRERQRNRPHARQRAQGGAADDRTLRFTRLTVSIGVAERDTGNVDAEEVLRAADRALYRAKAKGRNRVSA